MKVLILAGGFGSRLSEETEYKPKPMVNIGDHPILWHIMKSYSYFGFNEFIILLGYKGYVIKEYFANYLLHSNDLTIDVSTNRIDYHNNHGEPWKVTLIDTGINTMTGGRIKRAKDLVGNETFMLTYGDGVSDVNLLKVLEFHKMNRRLVTLTAVQPEGRFGILDIDPLTDEVVHFQEKPEQLNAWINGGFFVCEPEIFNYIEGDSTIFERKPLEDISNDRELVVYKHDGFWMCMDTLRDKHKLNEMVENNAAPWILWKK